MRNIKLTIEYDGKRYLGWQRLGDSEKTIQEKVEGVIKLLTGEEIEIVGSGRTDAGTHARGQVANFKTTHQMSLPEMQQFLTAICRKTSSSIRLKRCLSASMHAITPKASNTAIMFGTTRSHQSLLAIPVFIARSPLIWKKCSKRLRS